MTASVYNVTISAIAGSGNSAGFIDPKTIPLYRADGSEPTSITDSENKLRANARYKNLIMSLQSGANVYVSDIVVTGGSATTSPTQIAFTATVEHGDGSLRTIDETNNSAELVGEAALKRFIARGLTHPEKTVKWDIFDPTKTSGFQNNGTSQSVVRLGQRVVSVVVGQLTSSLTTAESSVTISKIS